MKYWPLSKHELVHFLASLIISVLILVIFKDFRLVLAVFAFGFFIDVDHLFDYLKWSKGKFVFSQFFKPHLYVHGSGKVYVFFHGWEFLPLLWLVARLVGIPGLNWAVFLSYLAHMAWDQLSVSPNPLGYFLTYRIINGFSLASFNLR